MPANFITIAWPLVFTMIVLAGFIVSIAAVTTLVTSIMRAHQLARGKGSQAPEEEDVTEFMSQPSRKSFYRPETWNSHEPGVKETVTMDEVHYIPIP